MDPVRRGLYQGWLGVEDQYVFHTGGGYDLVYWVKTVYLMIFTLPIVKTLIPCLSETEGRDNEWQKKTKNVTPSVDDTTLAEIPLRVHLPSLLPETGCQVLLHFGSQVVGHTLTWDVCWDTHSNLHLGISQFGTLPCGTRRLWTNTRVDPVTTSELSLFATISFTNNKVQPFKTLLKNISLLKNIWNFIV